MKRPEAGPRSSFRLLRWLGEEQGQDLAEYGMLSALIAVVVIAVLVVLGGSLASLWGNVTAAFAGLP